MLDTDLKQFIEQQPTLHLTHENLATIREGMNGQVDISIPKDLPVEVTEKRIPGSRGEPDVRVIIFTPNNVPAPRPAYLEIHGGGMVLATADTSNAENAFLATELGCTVVSVDYRLAPETKHPGQVEDCYAALKWMYNHARELGIDNSKIAIGGASAGAGLAAGLAVLARDRNEVKIIFQNLMVPMLDDRTCVAEPHPFAGEYVWTAENNRFGWKSLLGQEPGGEEVSPYASAPRAKDLSGLPSTFINVGAIDLFVDESMDYAKRLIRAGVPTELHVYPGAHHGAIGLKETRVGKIIKRDSLEAMRRAFYG